MACRFNSSQRKHPMFIELGSERGVFLTIYWVLSQFHSCIHGLSTKASERGVIPTFMIHACNRFMCLSKVPDHNVT